jgi:hypothetical protein
MKRVHRMLQGRSLVLTLALAIVAIGVFVSTLPAARAVIVAGPYVCAYYKEASHRTVVGARGVGCCGEIISWGSTSKYADCQPLLCLDVLCPN